MKKLTILILLFSISYGYSNGKYENQINDLATEVAELLENRGIQKVAVWNFVSMNADNDLISKYLSEDFSVHFTNATSTLQVFDRQYLDQILKELRLQQSGLMDPETTKEVGAFTGVEAIITGQYSILGKKIKIWIKALETESAFQIAAINGELELDKRIFPRTISKKRAQIKPDKSVKKQTSKKRKTGSLKLVNQKSVTVYVLVKKGDFEKIVLIGGDSSSEVLGLSPGIYDCEAGFENTRTPLETFQVKISPYRRSKKRFKGYRYSALSWMF